MKSICKILAGLGLIMVMVTGAQAQEQPNPDENRNEHLRRLVEQHTRTYVRAMRYNDYDAAKDALLQVVSAVPGNDSLLFNLSLLYYEMQKYPSALLAARDVLTLRPRHLGGLELAAMASENLGIREEALKHYETLYMETDQLEVLYKVAFMQFDLKRYNEARASSQIILDSSKADEVKMVFTLENDIDKEFPIKVALLNLKGMISEAEGNNEKARGYYQEALQIASDFPPARENLNKMK